LKQILQTVAVAALLTSTAQSAEADACEERFVRLLLDGNGNGPVKIHVTQEIKGAPVTENWFYQVSPGHWMTEMVTPADQPWVLTYDDAMYTSSDKGGTWTKLRDLDSDANADSAKANMMENAETARNAACGTEELDGVAYETVQADYDTLQNFKSENHHKYWVHPDTGFIAKAVYELKAENFESMTTQLIEAAPDLVLPTPD
jgi:hypothetical protein